jgi:hypothetical protein
MRRNARNAMTESAVAVAGGVRAYASAKGDAELLAKVDLWPSDFARERDTEVAGLCQGVHDAANSIIALLTDQGLAPADLTDLQDKIDLYSGTVGKPRVARSSNRAAGKLMDAEFAAADKLLEEQLDGLILKFKISQPEFYNAYFAARQIVDNPGGRPDKNGSGNGSNDHQPPMPPK